MGTFTSDLVVALIGGFFGAGFGAGSAILIARLERRSESRRRMVATVNALISDMSVRRSLSIELQTSERPDLDREADRVRTVRAILGVRALTLTARETVMGAPMADAELAKIIAYCNDYLELQECDLNGNSRLLSLLSERLNDCVERIAKAGLPGVEPIAPGSISRRSICLPELPTVVPSGGN